MKTIHSFLVFVLLLIVPLSLHARAQVPMPLNSGWQLQDAAQVTGSGETLSQADYQPAHWHPATVPGTVLTSLVNDGVHSTVPLHSHPKKQV